MFFLRKILTAAHCVCTYQDTDDPHDRVARYCLFNGPTTPVNQQTAKNPLNPKMKNYLVVSAGGSKEKDITKMKKVHVLAAFVMQTFMEPNGIQLKDGFDIGLIVPTDEGKKIMRKLNARPLILPAM